MKEENLRVLCIKTCLNIDNNEIIDYKKGVYYAAEIKGDDILAIDEFGEMCLIGQLASVAVELGIQAKENGKWDDWFNNHFILLD